MISFNVMRIIMFGGKDKEGEQDNLAMSLQNDRGWLYKQDADSHEECYALKAF